MHHSLNYAIIIYPSFIEKFRILEFIGDLYYLQFVKREIIIVKYCSVLHSFCKHKDFGNSRYIFWFCFSYHVSISALNLNHFPNAIRNHFEAKFLVKALFTIGGDSTDGSKLAR